MYSLSCFVYILENLFNRNKQPLSILDKVSCDYFTLLFKNVCCLCEVGQQDRQRHAAKQTLCEFDNLKKNQRHHFHFLHIPNCKYISTLYFDLNWQIISDIKYFLNGLACLYFDFKTRNKFVGFRLGGSLAKSFFSLKSFWALGAHMEPLFPCLSNSVN